MLSGHGDYHPAAGRSFLGGNQDIAIDSPSSLLGGEALLERVFNAYRSAASETGSNVWNTTLLIGWDEPGGTYDHVPPGPVPPPDPGAPAGEMGFKFDRSGYRVPAILVSPWVEPGSIYNEESRHTSLIATLRKAWGLGDPLTQRDASARTFEHLFTRDTPRTPTAWTTVQAQPVPMGDRLQPRQQGAQRPRQDDRTRRHRTRQGNGCRKPPGGSRRPEHQRHTRVDYRSHQGCRLALLPPTCSGRRKPRKRSLRQAAKSTGRGRLGWPSVVPGSRTVRPPWENHRAPVGIRTASPGAPRCDAGWPFLQLPHDSLNQAVHEAARALISAHAGAEPRLDSRGPVLRGNR